MLLDLDNWLVVVGIAIVILLACVGLITLTFFFIKMTFNFHAAIDDLDDWFDGCDWEKVKEQMK